MGVWEEAEHVEKRFGGSEGTKGGSRMISGQFQ